MKKKDGLEKPVPDDGVSYKNGPWAIPHDLSDFWPAPAPNDDSLDIVQFFLYLMSQNLDDTGLVAHCDDQDYTIRRLVHSYELVREMFHEAVGRKKKHRPGSPADTLAHALYLAEGLIFLALKYQMELDVLIDDLNKKDKEGEDWKEGA